MAYPISQEALELFTAPYRQVVDINFYGLSDELKITDEDIVLGGLSVNRYCVSGSKIEIGSVIAAEMELKLNNSDGRYNNVQFEGAEMYVRVGVKDWDLEDAAYHYVPFGYFTVDEAPRKLETITLTALDRMVLFDKTVDTSLLSFPMTVSELLNKICEICNVTLGTDISAFPNYSYKISAAPATEDLTYRQLLSWIAELTGTCGFIDWNGHLILKWYEQTDTVLTVQERFDSDLEENAVTITGVQVIDDDEEVYLAGDDEYVFSIESNDLIQHDYEDVAEALYSVLGDFSYIPFSATVKPMPHLYPLDIITFVDKNNTEHTTIITDYTFTVNMNTAIEGKGETATQSGYASANPLTKRESAIIKSLKKEQNTTLDNRIQSVLALNETIANSLGLYQTTVEQADGSTITYYHNELSLEESSIIYVQNAGGFAWTHDWNDGDPVWEYGFTQDGNAVYNILSTYKIQTKYLEAGCITAEKLSVEYIQSVNNALSLKVSSADLASEISATTDTITLSTGQLVIDTNNFKLDKSGNVTMTGTISAVSGVIGGWTIGTNKIYVTSDDGTVAVIQKPSSNVTNVFCAGGTSHENYSDCSFRVTKAGDLWVEDIINSEVIHNGGVSGDGYLKIKSNTNICLRLQTQTTTSNYYGAVLADIRFEQNGSQVFLRPHPYKTNMEDNGYEYGVYLGSSAASYTRWLGVYAKAGDFSTTLNVSGAATLGSKLDVSGAATLSSTLAVSGYSYLNNAAITNQIRPTATDTYYLGTENYRWSSSHIKQITCENIYFTGTSSSNTIRPTSDNSNNVSLGSTSYPFYNLYLSHCVYYTNAPTGSGTAVYINSNGALVKYSSSRSLKNSIGDVTDEVLTPERLYNLPVRQYKYNDGVLEEADDLYNKPVIGFIADEVEAVYPTACAYNSDGTPGGWNGNILLPAMMSLIQKHHTVLDNFEERIQALEKKA